MAFMKAFTNGGGGATLDEETINITNSGASRTIAKTDYTKNFVAIKSLENLADSTRQPFAGGIDSSGNITYYLVNISGSTIPSGSYSQQIKIVGYVE